MIRLGLCETAPTNSPRQFSTARLSSEMCRPSEPYLAARHRWLGALQRRPAADPPPWLKTTLIQCAWAATRKKGSYLQAQFLRVKNRRGPKKAIVAVAASMLTAAFFMLRDGVEYHDLGGRYFVDRDKAHLTKCLLRRLRDLGIVVEVKAA